MWMFPVLLTCSAASSQLLRQFSYTRRAAGDSERGFSAKKSHTTAGPSLYTDTRTAIKNAAVQTRTAAFLLQEQVFQRAKASAARRCISSSETICVGWLMDQVKPKGSRSWP